MQEAMARTIQTSALERPAPSLVDSTRTHVSRALDELTGDSLADLPIADVRYTKALLRAAAPSGALQDALSNLACSSLAAALARAYDGIGVAVQLRRSCGRSFSIPLHKRARPLLPLHWINGLCAAQLSGQRLVSSALTSSRVSGPWIRRLAEHEMHWIPMFSYWTRLAMELQTPPPAAMLDDVITLCAPSPPRRRWCAMTITPLLALAKALERGDVAMLRLAARSALLRTCEPGGSSISLPLLAMIHDAHRRGLCPSPTEVSPLFAFIEIERFERNDRFERPEHFNRAPHAGPSSLARASLALTDHVVVLSAADAARLRPALVDSAWRDSEIGDA